MKTILASLILLLTATTASAQRLNAGLKVGANFSKLSGDSWEQGYRSNLLGGLFVQAPGRRVSLQLEGLFSQSTYHTGRTARDFYSQYYNDIRDSLKAGSFRVSYLSIPLLLQLWPNRTFCIEAGPQYSLMVDVDDREKLLQDAKAVFGTLSFDGVLGLNVRVSKRIQLSGRYIFGFTDLNNTETFKENWQQRNIQAHLGYRF